MEKYLEEASAQIYNIASLSTPCLFCGIPWCGFSCGEFEDFMGLLQLTERIQPLESKDIKHPIPVSAPPSFSEDGKEVFLDFSGVL